MLAMTPGVQVRPGSCRTEVESCDGAIVVYSDGGQGGDEKVVVNALGVCRISLMQQRS